MLDRPERDPVLPVRLIATDLDGTLLRSDGTVSERTRRALERAQAAGAVLVLVTARPPRTLRAMAREIGVGGLAICCNGALVYDLDENRIVQHSPLRSEVARGLVVALREEAPGVAFACELGTRYGWEPGYLALKPSVRRQEGIEADALLLCAEPVTKLIVRHPQLPIESLLAIACRLIGDAAHATHSSSSFVEVSAAGVQKGWALARLCSRLGVAASDVVAFGDMPNDLPMLTWAGLGIAVANAHPEVLEAAGETTLSNEEDGVAVVLERFFPPGCSGAPAAARRQHDIKKDAPANSQGRGEHG
jgi:Cof subfamily protein (haloacid dehalogenase superfamily)